MSNKKKIVSIGGTSENTFDVRLRFLCVFLFVVCHCVLRSLYLGSRQSELVMVSHPSCQHSGWPDGHVHQSFSYALPCTNKKTACGQLCAPPATFKHDGWEGKTTHTCMCARTRTPTHTHAMAHYADQTWPSIPIIISYSLFLLGDPIIPSYQKWPALIPNQDQSTDVPIFRRH